MLYGRDAERARIAALLSDARASQSGALVVRGDPGVGKTALLESAREGAGGMHVLRTKGVESESELAFAALHRLLRPALVHIDALPDPQATALRAALGLAPRAGDERFLVFAACLTLLSELAEQQPVLCLIDDAHWLDSASADALLFVARRLEAEGIAMLFAAREADVRRFEAQDLPSLSVRGLAPDAAAALLSSMRGRAPAAAVRERLVAHADGNPLALLELPGALTTDQLSGAAPLPDALPLTRELERTFADRARRLPDHARRLLLIAAADDTERLAPVARAADALALPLDGLAEAERAGLVAVRDARLEFRHPLVRSAIYNAASVIERSAAHRALAAAHDASEDDRRAWHLAAAALEPDEAVTRELEAVAERAYERTGYGAAAKALERAAELSAERGARGRRLVGAARAASLAGQAAHAAALARQAAPLVDDPLLKAEIARVRAVEELAEDRAPQAQRILLDAAAEVAPSSRDKALELLTQAADAARDIGLESLVTVCHAAGALPAGEPTTAALVLEALGTLATGDLQRGAPLVERALAATERSDDPRELLLGTIAGTWMGNHDRVIEILGRAAALARARGAMAHLCLALSLRCGHFCITQRLDEATIAATEAMRLGRELGVQRALNHPLGTLAYVAAVRGNDAEAADFAAETQRLDAHRRHAASAAVAAWALALIEIGHARWEAALDLMQPLVLPEDGIHSPLITMTMAPDCIEAAVRCGRTGVARAALDEYERWATTSAAAWATPVLAACRGLLATGAEATSLFEAAAAGVAAARPFDRGRIHLLHGEHLRRERRRIDARAALRQALDAFERLGARPWAERARAELRASGETARRRDPSTVDQLTAQELQVADLVSQGLSNKEVAAQLFLSPRTIEAHLRSVYAKLGITSRTQLARIPLVQDAAGSPVAV